MEVTLHFREKNNRERIIPDSLKSKYSKIIPFQAGVI
jgi:hypothetical protein